MLLKLIISLLSVFTALVSVTLAAGHTRGEGELAFVSMREGSYDIYLMDVWGGQFYNLTRHPGRDDYPVWSPDGSRLAFISSRDHALQVFVVNADGSGLRQVTCGDTGAINPAWSPDGSRLLFLSQRDTRWGLYVTASDAPACDPSQPRLVANLLRSTSMPGRPAWSPDGQHIALAFGAMGEANVVHVIDPSSGDMTRLNTVLVDTRVAWSADSASLVYTDISTRAAIYRVDLDDGERHNLSGRGFPAGAAAWSSMNNQIVFVSKRGGMVDVYRVERDGDGLTRLTDNGYTARPAWSPDGRWISYEAFDGGNSELYLMPADGGTPHRLTTHPADDQFAAWRPTTKH